MGLQWQCISFQGSTKVHHCGCRCCFTQSYYYPLESYVGSTILLYLLATPNRSDNERAMSLDVVINKIRHDISFIVDK